MIESRCWAVASYLFLHITKFHAALETAENLVMNRNLELLFVYPLAARSHPFATGVFVTFDCTMFACCCRPQLSHPHVHTHVHTHTNAYAHIQPNPRAHIQTHTYLCTHTNREYVLVSRRANHRPCLRVTSDKKHKR